MDSNNEVITIKKENLWKYSTFVLLAVVVIGAFVFFTTGDSTTTTGAAVNVPTNNVPSQPAKVDVDVDDDAVLGDKKAPVTIVEFSDYQCPFCRKFWQDTYPQLKKEYIETGKVKLVFRDFPLSFHAMAMPSAIAAECIREKGGDTAYWKYHDKLFQEQNTLDGGSVKSTVQYTNEDLKAWAKSVGYDISSCLDSQKYKSEVEKDMAEGQSFGASGTPAFFVNGRLISGAQPFANFKQIIDAELASA